MKHVARDYSLTINGNQLEIVKTALEWFFRLQMGQYFDYCTEIAHNGYVYDRDNPENDRLFAEYIQRRNESQEKFIEAYRIACPRVCSTTEDVNIAIDIWQEVRYFLWKERPEPKPHDTVDSRNPLHRSSEPPIQIRRADHDTE